MVASKKLAMIDQIRRSIRQNNSRLDDGLIHFESHEHRKVAFPTMQGATLVKIQNICFFRSKEPYCELVDIDGNTLFINKSLKWVENRLKDTHFYRVHRSYIINLYNITRYSKIDGGELIMENGLSIPISRRRRTSVARVMGW